MKYLVTGGAGFIGSHITQKLLEKGHSVRVLDNFSSGKMENLSFALEGKFAKKFELLRGDICDYASCLMACNGMDFVLHQAALRSVPKSLQLPESYNKVNIDGILNILKVAVEAKIKRFVFASSSSVYGDTKIFPEKETAYPLLISPYALSKLAGEYYCRIFSEHFGLETVALRYFNVFGPRQALDDEYAVVIPKFISCILKNEQPPVYGTGKQSRDFTYIDNVVQANILAANTPKLRHEVFNVANGRECTVLRLISLLNKIAKSNVSPKFLDPRQGDVFRTSASLAKIKAKLGYQPKVSFEEGLLNTFKWFKNSLQK